MSKADLKDALETVQKILRENGLQHLAAQVPTQAADLEVVRGRVRVINGLLRLRPPSETVREQLDRPLQNLSEAIERS